MNNSFSFLDTSSNPNMPRSAPSPTSSQSGSQTNGMIMGGGGNGNAPPPQTNGGGGTIPMVNGLPSGGQQTDMNYLWSVVQQLSQMLDENRAQTAGIINGVQSLRQRAAEDGGSVGGMGIREVNGELDAASRAAEITDLQSRLSNAETTINSLNSTNSQLASLLTDYENALTLLLEKLRPYAYTQTQAIISLHKHYQGLLDTERNTSMQMRLEHAEWQAGLGRVAEYARGALKGQAESEMGLRSEIRELKEENRVLRRLAGWEAKPDSENEEDQEKS
ncbi:unnamed protein product [Periconia digitata]|uniref:Uncharacterized protein n=1 Tax=Periconia digitata TaxID=1303443 RepID=A0A9W4UC80_9PLEO|nr:unnamed protein product [Periconia digitata]